MKKIFSLIMCLLFCFVPITTAFAEETPSQPRVMVTDYKTDGELKAGGTAKITVELTNLSKTVDVRNLKLTFSDSSGDIVPVGVASGYFEKLYARWETEWDIEVKISDSAKDGNHPVTITIEYESEAGSSNESRLW